MKLPPDIKKKWVDALRSGEFTQGTNYLASQIEVGPLSGRPIHHPAKGEVTKATPMCCLGVLQFILDGDVERSVAGQSLPLPSAEWATQKGIEHVGTLNTFNSPSWCPHVKLPDFEAADPLFYVNDTAGLSFAKIADVIEEQL